MRAQMRTGAVACLVAITMSGLVACSSDTVEGASTASSGATDPSTVHASPTPPSRTSLLGVVNASGGSYDDGTLTLTGVSPNGVWFTDRPARQAGTTSVEDLLPLFFDETAPPNAAVEFSAGDEGGVAIVELTDPSWDDETGELSFDAEPIGDVDPDRLVEHPSLAAHVADNEGELPASFGPAALFIDSGHGLTPQEQGGGLTPVESTTTTGPSKPVNPKVVPDAAAVQTLAADTAAAQSTLESLIPQFRNSIDEDPTTCKERVMDQTSIIYTNLLTVLVPQVTALQQDVTDNDGTLPASDDAAFESASSYLQSVQDGTEEVASVFSRC